MPKLSVPNCLKATVSLRVTFSTELGSVGLSLET